MQTTMRLAEHALQSEVTCYRVDLTNPMGWVPPMMLKNTVLPCGTTNELASPSLGRISHLGNSSVWNFPLSYWTIPKSVEIKLYKLNQTSVCGYYVFHLREVPSNYLSYYYHHGRIFLE